jgi:hypothetical protein
VHGVSVSLRGGVEGVEESKAITVPHADGTRIKARGDPGAAIRGPLVGDKGADLAIMRGAPQSLQEAACAGVPHAQAISPESGDKAGRAPIGWRVRAEEGEGMAVTAFPCVDWSWVALRPPRLTDHRRQGGLTIGCLGSGIGRSHVIRLHNDSEGRAR